MQPQTESIKQKIKKKYYLLKALLTNHQGKWEERQVNNKKHINERTINLESNVQLTYHLKMYVKYSFRYPKMKRVLWPTL